VVCLKEFTKFIYLNKENQQEAKCRTKLTNRLIQIKITRTPSIENPHHKNSDGGFSRWHDTNMNTTVHQLAPLGSKHGAMASALCLIVFQAEQTPLPRLIEHHNRSLKGPTAFFAYVSRSF
jgi:hypothetical protein